MIGIGLWGARLAPRTLAHVLFEIADAQRAFDASRNQPNEMDCLDRLFALQDEARAMIESATGVSWTAISAASL